jgi:hypothetical protein
MGKKPYYTSNELIEAVKRKISMPVAQVTFNEEDILNFANEEMFLSQIPTLLQYHEEYLVYRHKVDLLEDVQKYEIPERAIGMKLRDLFFVDNQGNIYEMTNVGAGNQDVFQQNSFGTHAHKSFYLENNHIVLPTKVGSAPAGSLEMIYFLRPNSLVSNERAAICTGFVKEITINNTNLTAGKILSIDDTNFVANTDFTIGVSSTATATNLASAINASQLDGITASSSGAIVKIVYEERNTEIISDTTGMIVSDRTGVQATIPAHFEDRMYVDFLQTAGGHRTYSFDVRIPSNGVSSDAVFFPDDKIPSDFKLGDYICQQHECIIPQIPSDLHNLLAERTCARILEALGDQAGLQTANSKIAELEQKQSTLINNRVEGSPKKIFAKHGLLRYGKFRGSRGRYP